MPHADWYLEEIIRLEGRGDAVNQSTCARCTEDISAAIYRCRDCLDTRMFCLECTLLNHQTLPFHSIWVSQFLQSLLISIVLNFS